jgi:hypothetical protein
MPGSSTLVMKTIRIIGWNTPISVSRQADNELQECRFRMCGRRVSEGAE